jgi:oxygen-independent coproporphyrinogen III oxidase
MARTRANPNRSDSPPQIRVIRVLCRFRAQSLLSVREYQSSDVAIRPAVPRLARCRLHRTSQLLGVSFRVPPRHVYVHVPFCARRCSYCDFAIAVRRSVPIDEYVTGIERELALRFPESEPWTTETLYLGGGTPSKLGGDGVARLIETLLRRLSLVDDAEVTLEANPEDVTEAAVRAWRAAGVNRLSLGAQSFDDDVLRWMHRTHDAEQIRTAVQQAQDAGLEDVSLDLIFALPDEVPRRWEADVASALALRPNHVSLYGLTIEPATPLGRWHARGTAAEATEERYECEYLYAHQTLGAAGFDHYEVSNFALPHRAARHNSAYWRGVPYAGLGPGAHEFDGRERRWNVKGYVEWLRRVGAGGDPKDGSEELSADNRTAEDVYLGLRTRAGLRLAGAELVRAQPWVAAGWGKLRGDALVLNPMGWLRLDSLAADLTVLRSRS